ncbi:hypothetical protein O6P43_006312 [Quillaja saponaria]|uniref:Uncharacterized protein n=1 Tax=Quillaja saponaria TaxID=32244 RepID=A0AAD7Q7Y1_QUISA|nr:hypothetical protein O6P43_006312 [Quillaja saponaria]
MSAFWQTAYHVGLPLFTEPGDLSFDEDKLTYCRSVGNSYLGSFEHSFTMYVTSDAEEIDRWSVEMLNRAVGSSFERPLIMGFGLSWREWENNPYSRPVDATMQFFFGKVCLIIELDKVMTRLPGSFFQFMSSSQIQFAGIKVHGLSATLFLATLWNILESTPKTHRIILLGSKEDHRCNSGSLVGRSSIHSKVLE